MGRRAVTAAAELIVQRGRDRLLANISYSLAARGYSYDPAFLACVYIGDLLYGPEPPDCLEKLFRANTTLLPEKWMDEQPVEKIADRVSDTVRPDFKALPARPDNWEDLLDAALVNVEDDRYALEAFPPRTNQDLGIRYARAADVWTFYMAHGRRAELVTTLRLLKHFDYITMVNVLTAKIMFTRPVWWMTMERAGCFAAGSEHFRLAARALSDTIKKEKVALSPDDRVAFYESASLYGAMCPPVPGWDPVEESRALAEGGQDQHGLLLDCCPGYSTLDFHEAVRKLAFVQPRDTPDSRTFRKWLWDEEWARSGASSLGRVEYRLRMGDEVRTGKFKARKNLVLDVVSIDELERRTRTYTKQENVALIKTELAKIRLAVSCPIETYLAQAWIYLVTGNAYSNWPANTLEEPLHVEIARHEETWERLQTKEYSLPYDFARFDHQPTTSEVKAFQIATNICGRRYARPEQMADYEQLSACVTQGYDHATLTSPPGLGEQKTFHVTGGLMSGLRSTSCVGSGWNATFGEFARRMIDEMRHPDHPPQVWQLVRGDDTQVTGRSYHDVLAIKIGYDAMGAIANESKFTLRQGRTEFLRIETEDRLRGYPCRTIPMMTQRRPWNARPVVQEAGLEHVLKTMATLRLRLPTCDGLDAYRDHYIRRCFRLLRLDSRLRNIPAALGGLGVDPWDGRWSVQTWQSIRPPPVEIVNRTDYREQRVAEEFAAVDVPVDAKEVTLMASERIRAKVAADDVPEFSGVMRNASRRELHGRKFRPAAIRRDRIHQLLAELGSIATRIKCIAPERGGYDQLRRIAAEAVQRLAPDWGCCRRFADVFNRLSELARVREQPLGPMLRRYLPHFAHKLTEVERRYRLRRTAAIDFVLGDLSGVGADRLPSAVPTLVAKLAAASVGMVTRYMRTASPHEASYAFMKGYEAFSSCIMNSSYGKTFFCH
nr:MAG: RNA-dependent RNA polymerase [Totiviridae sp.]